ncbi:MAG: MBOAT family protein, partial [Planctomycetaceae bacterium]|nr:MBOAT family protein [Planctomycetaceae bacterium]
MLFNSFGFWAFFATVLLLYWRLSHRGQNLLLLVASYYFYGSWDWRFLGLILLTTTWDFLFARAIAGTDSPGRKRFLLAASVILNLSVLGFFKYFGFFSQELATWMTALGLTPLLPTLNILLPVGISFFTFQSMSYTIDVYRGDVQPARNWFDFALYISFFPQLVAGPIERAQTLLPQVLRPRKWKSEFFAEGLHDIVLGLFQKIVVADNMAVLVNCVFATPTSELTGTEVLLGIY